MRLSSKVIAKAFNSNVLNDIANDDFSTINELAASVLGHNSGYSLPQFFDDAFAILENEYKNEYYYKNLLANKILLGKHSLKTATMLSEFRVGTSKADCVILNGISTCYEIKTDYDNLSRLDDQLSSYTKLFDEVYVVCSEKLSSSVIESIPSMVGVMVLTERRSFSIVKKAIKRTSPIDRKLLMQSLRKMEYIELAQKISNSEISCPNTIVYEKCFEIIEHCSDDVLNSLFIQILKKSRKNNDELLDILPRSLTNAAISYRFTKKEACRLKSYFHNEGEIDVLPNSAR